MLANTQTKINAHLCVNIQNSTVDYVMISKIIHLKTITVMIFVEFTSGIRHNWRNKVHNIDMKKSTC